MKTKAIFLTLALFATTALLAQTKATVKPKKTTTTMSSQMGTSSGSSSGTAVNTLCYQGKTWKLVKVQKFGVEKDPGDDQKTDMLQLNTDATFKIILKGVEKTGTYSRGTWLNLKPADGSEALPIKVESCDGTTLQADWRDGDTHNHFTYKAQ